MKSTNRRHDHFLLDALESRRLLSEYFVAPTGLDTNPGTVDRPFQSIQRAAMIVTAGDTVNVRAGSYGGFVMGSEPAHSGVPGSPITFKAEPGAIIVNRNYKTPDGINLEGTKGIVIDGFTIKNNGAMSRAGIRVVQNDNVVIRNNTVENAGMWGIFAAFSYDLTIEGNSTSGAQREHGIYVSNSSDRPIIRGNRVFNNAGSGIHMNGDLSAGGDGIIFAALVENNTIYGNGARGGSGINADGIQNSIIRGNVLYDNRAGGIALFKTDAAEASKNNQVLNNTIVMTADARWALTISGGSTGNVVYDNILQTENRRRGSIELAEDSRAGFVSDSNILVERMSLKDDIISISRWRQFTGQDAHSIVTTVQELFVDPKSRNFQLSASSPAIGAGREGKDIGALQSGKTRPAAATQRAGIIPEGLITFKTAIIAAVVAVAASIVSVIAMLKKRRVDRWLLAYLTTPHKRRPWPRNSPTHVLLCVADHYEPCHGGVSAQRAQDRVDQWVEQYPRLFSSFRDHDGRPPRHTFFYPLEEYVAAHLDSLAPLCDEGFGEIEVHLHHDNDTSENLRRTLVQYKQMLVRRHGMLPRRRDTGEPVYGFIHGNWALDNSRPDGKWCGVNNELDVLRETGCYCDFTLPSAPSATQTAKINSIYYAVDDPHHSCSHNHGVDIGCCDRPADSLMLIQGPLLLNWNDRKFGLLPRIENSCIQYSQPPTILRMENWLRARVQVPNRPDWFFVKLHTHGAPEENQKVLLGPAMVKFHQDLADLSRRESNFHVHYVTAREMYNLARAAEAGWTGSVEDALDYELIYPGRDAVQMERSASRVSDFTPTACP